MAVRNGKEKEPRGKYGSIATIRLRFGGDYFKKMRKSVSGRASDSFISISSLVSVQKFVMAEFFFQLFLFEAQFLLREDKIYANLQKNIE